MILLWYLNLFSQRNNKTGSLCYPPNRTTTQYLTHMAEQSRHRSNFSEYRINNIAPDKKGCPHNIFSHFFMKNLCRRYSLEVSRWGASNKYHNICFCGEIRKILITFEWKKHQIWCYFTLLLRLVFSDWSSAFFLLSLALSSNLSVSLRLQASISATRSLLLIFNSAISESRDLIRSWALQKKVIVQCNCTDGQGVLMLKWFHSQSKSTKSMRTID